MVRTGSKGQATRQRIVELAAPVLPWLLGSEWEQTAPLLALLAVAVPWRLLLGTTVALAITAGRARAVVVWEAVRLVITAGAVALATTGGLSTTAAVVSLATIVLLTGEHALAGRVGHVLVPRWLVAATGAASLLLLVLAVVVVS